MKHLHYRIMLVLLITALLVPVRPVQPANRIYYENGQEVEQPSEKSGRDLKVLEPYSADIQHLFDYGLGYSLNIPADMQLDLSLAGLRTVAYNDRMRIEIYYDNLAPSKSCNSALAFINYNNRFLSNDRDHHLQDKSFVQRRNLAYYQLVWSRDKLCKVPGDLNYYARAHYVTGAQEVYTVFIKSDQPIQNYTAIFDSFARIEKKGPPGFYARYQPVEREWNESTQAFYEQYLSEKAGLTWGIFEPYAPGNFAYLEQLEKKLNYNFPLILVYQCLNSELPLTVLQNAQQQHKTVELTLQTSSPALDEAGNQRLVYDILQGDYDSYFHTYARQVKEFGQPVLFRLNNEMNGDWCSYSAYYTAGDTELYQALWRYVYAVFAAEKADNVIWVWNPHDLSFPDCKWNQAFLYYPGDAYVDVIGLTGYNTGNYYPGEFWREFAAIYDPLVRNYRAVFSQPLMITEFGSNSVGGDKAVWIKSMFANLYRYPQIKIAVWWNGTDWDSQMKPARIYRLDENPAAVNAFKEGLAARTKEPQ